MESIDDSRKIIYVFDAAQFKDKCNIVSEHVIHYLNNCGVYIKSGDFLNGNSKKGLEYYQAAFSCDSGAIKVKRDGISGSKYWLLETPNEEQINIYDNGNITFCSKLEYKTTHWTEQYLRYIRTMSTKNSVSFRCARDYCSRMWDDTQFNCHSTGISSAQLDIHWDEFGNVEIELFYKDRNIDFAKKHSILIGGHVYSVEKYIGMLNDSICNEGIPLEEQKWLKVLFLDPRLSAILEKLLKKIPTSKEEWYSLKRKNIDGKCSDATTEELNLFANQQVELQTSHDKRIASIRSLHDRQCKALDTKSTKLDAKLAEGFPQDDDRPRLIKIIEGIY